MSHDHYHHYQLTSLSSPGIVSGQYPLEEAPGPLSQMSEAVASLDRPGADLAPGGKHSDNDNDNDDDDNTITGPCTPHTPGLPATPNTPGTGHKSPRSGHNR